MAEDRVDLSRVELAAVFKCPGKRSLLVERVNALLLVVLHVRTDELLHGRLANHVLDVDEELVALLVRDLSKRIVGIVPHEHGVDRRIGVVVIVVGVIK